MTDHKSWLWRKKSSDKSIVVTEKGHVPSREIEEEMHVLRAEKAELERDLRDLGDKLSSALAECDAKDDLVKKHAKTAKEALAGWEKAEAKALSLKQELDDALKQRDISEDREHHLDAALKECMQQLRFVREDQEQRIHDVMVKASEEVEEIRMFLDEKLEESDQKVAGLTAENSQLSELILMKEQLIEDLNRQVAKADADINALLTRLEHMEKDNNSLRYEVRLLEKEVNIRNEEREFNRRTADASHKQHLENVKKIAKLESECQRIRVLVRKRLPGPAALAKMKSEVDMLQRNSRDNGRKKSHSSISNLQLSYVADNYPEPTGKKINNLTEKICALEEENHSLQETLQKMMNELQISRVMYVQTASKLSQVQAQLQELPKSHLSRDIRSIRISHDQSLASMSDVGSDDKVSCAGSWASALVSELEVIRDGKDKSPLSSKSVQMPDIRNFMDDFAEMEKLALVCVDKPIDNSPDSKRESHLDSSSESTGKELVPVTFVHEDVARTKDITPLPSNLSKSISRLIEIVEGINLPSEHYEASQTPSARNENDVTLKNLETPTGYLIRVFQWRTSELAALLQKFLHTCEDLLNGKADFEMFTQELASVLERIINHCFSLQDVSCMKDSIKKQMGLDETRSGSETEVGMVSLFSETDKLSLLKEQLVSSAVEASNGFHKDSHCELSQDDRELNDGLKNFLKQELEVQSATQDLESLRNQLQCSESFTSSLQKELDTLKQAKAVMEDQFETDKMTIEDLSSQLVTVTSELGEARQNFTSLEGELKNKVKRCVELEAKCRELKVQSDRETNPDTYQDVNHGEKQLRTEQEISAASEKLVECQETILLLGKQIRAIESSRNVVVSDKFISTTPTTNANSAVLATTATQTSVRNLTSQRSSLYQMLAEDGTEVDHLESPETKEIISTSDSVSQPSGEHLTKSSTQKNQNDISDGSLAIVPSSRRKQQTTSAGLFKKLLWRKKRSSSKKLKLPFSA